jgi:hypothetical protein
MNSQLVIQDFGGSHNGDLDKTRARLLKGGSWKRQRIVVVIPTDKLLPAKTALALWNLGFPPNNGVARILAQGMEVGEAYSTAIEGILAHPELSQWEYLLTVEHDNLPPADGVVKLVEQMEQHPEFACIGGLYFTKGPEGVAQIWGDPSDPVLNFRPLMPVQDQLVECCGTGMGFNLWRMSMFKDGRLRKPWFKTLNGKEGQGIGTQDLYFWGDARKYGYRCAIDNNVLVGHYDAAADICW